MPSFERPPDQAPTIRDISRPPLYIYKTGILGAIPLDFPSKLAEHHGMSFISSDVVRSEIMAEREEKGRTHEATPDIDLTIKTIIQWRSTRLLARGVDVVVDMFANSRKSRGELLQTAQNSGALAVCLAVEAPEEIIKQRVKEWSETNAFITPTDRWGNMSPLQVAEKMIKQHTRPAQPKGGTTMFYLDGSGTTQDLLDQTETYFQAMAWRHILNS